ncbi:Uncharacterised protein [Klebsiella pneumoniae]|nr:Uncharacterised protein [Klebsiella pneumoniae]
MGNMRKISAVANAFVENFQEDFKNGIFFVIYVGTRINIEQNDFSRVMHRFVNIGKE